MQTRRRRRPRRGYRNKKAAFRRAVNGPMGPWIMWHPRMIGRATRRAILAADGEMTRLFHAQIHVPEIAP